MNTLVIESKVSRVSCNPVANVVINKPFYVAPLAKLADDNEYLKVELWPMLEELCDSADISHFRSRISGTLNNLATEVHELTEEKAPFLDSKTLEGEGTCEPRGSKAFTSPHLHFLAILMSAVHVCRKTSSGGRQGQRRRRQRTRNVKDHRKR